MATIADYHALRDGPFVLSQNGSRSQSINFNPPNDIKRYSDIDRPVLCFRVDPSNNASNLQLTVQSNENNVGPTPEVLNPDPKLHNLDVPLAPCQST
ncbi:hypothetical protein [Moorena sp. SIO3A5]|uniref:hypothetical protein n=1 Tax=Moorena sp. SIO3A5 TaxID=2607822 RepID=UPI00141D0346|nr:hypothetical protein [Moorena sp. SIO3A5]NEP68993.1 hypothetical protein [Moorena sp. SIO3A5]